MYVNKPSGAQGYVLDNNDNARQSISGVYKSNESVSLVSKDITGLTEVSNGSLLLDNCNVKRSDDNACVSEVLVKVNNGSVNVCNKSRIGGSVECSNGNIRITDAHIDNDIGNTAGSVTLNAVSARDVITTNGKVELHRSMVASVSNLNGGVLLYNTTVSGDVKASNGLFYIHGSTVQGQLELEGN